MRALILAGGGMRGAYGSGVAHALASAGHRFDAVYGTSVGGAMGAWFAAGQTDDGMQTWDAAQDPDVMSYTRWLTGRGPLIDLELLYGRLYEERYRLDVDRIRSCGFPVYVTATDALSGELALLDLRKVDVPPALMATSGIPYATEAPFEIDGRLFFDGGVASPVPVQAALDDGADEIVVVFNDRPEDRNGEPWLFAWHFGRRWPQLADKARRHNELFKRAVRQATNPPNGVKTTVIVPSEMLGIGRFTRDMGRIEEAIALGERDARRAFT